MMDVFVMIKLGLKLTAQKKHVLNNKTLSAERYILEIQSSEVMLMHDNSKLQVDRVVQHILDQIGIDSMIYSTKSLDSNPTEIIWKKKNLIY